MRGDAFRWTASKQKGTPNDDPILMKESVGRLRPDATLSSPGQTFLELVRGKK